MRFETVQQVAIWVYVLYDTRQFEYSQSLIDEHSQAVACLTRYGIIRTKRKFRNFWGSMETVTVPLRKDFE